MNTKLFISLLLLTSFLCSCDWFQDEEKLEYNPQDGASVYNQNLLRSRGIIPRYQKMYEFPIRELPEEVLSHIPDGHLVIDTASGDLNCDGYKDLVLVSSRDANDTEEDFRPLFIFFGSVVGFELHDFSERAILGRNSGGMMPDPFERMGVKEGFLVIKHYGGSGANLWRRQTVFIYDPAKNYFEMVSDIHEDWQMERDNNYSLKNLSDLEDIISFREFDIYD